MPQPLMAYQPQLFPYADPARSQCLSTSNRRSSARYESTSYSPSSYPPSGTSRGSWPLSSNQQFPVRLSGDSQSNSWTQSNYAPRRMSEPYSILEGDGLAASPPFQPSSPWSSASDISPSTPPLYATPDPYGRPAGVPAEPLDWSSVSTSGYQAVAQSDIRTQISSGDTRRYSSVQVEPFDRQSWDDMLASVVSESSSYTPPPQGLSLEFLHRISPDPSPSPPPFYQHTLPNPTSVPRQSAAGSRRGSVDRTGAVKQCSHCHATSTPLWRREPTTLKPLCNACGLYLQQRNKLRPQELIDADTDDGDSTDSDQNYVGPECSHCRTHRTSVWRRSKTGEQLCNACGVYLRLRGKPRPLSLKKNKIKPRTKHAPKP